MSVFGRALARHAHDPSGRRWWFVPYDQLSAALGPLSREPTRELGIVLVACPGKAATRAACRGGELCGGVDRAW